MMMKFNAWVLIGIIGISLFGAQFGVYYVRAVGGNADMWWTPKTMALSLNDTMQTFEIFLNDELLQNHIDRGSLSATDRNGQPNRVASDDIVVRLNNWHRTKASLLHYAVFMALLLGASMMSMAVGVTQMIVRKKNIGNQASEFTAANTRDPQG